MTPERPTTLVIVDGFGLGDGGPGDAIAAASMPAWRRLLATWPHARLAASGIAVGLPEGQMGNSEVGHLNIGSGQRVPQDLPRIDRAIEHGELAQLPALREAVDAARGGTLHLILLLGPGGVHAHDRHGVALAAAARAAGAAQIAIHLVLDGRDTPPGSAAGDLRDFSARLAVAAPAARIATVSGRYFAMDRDGRWERTALAVAAIAGGEGRRAADPAAAIAAAAARGEGDEFVLPTVIDGATPYRGMRAGDAVIHGNYRADRARQLARALGGAAPELPGRPPVLPVPLWGMTAYEETGGPPALFPHQVVPSLAGVLAVAGLPQLHLAETEKYAHVTYFLNGGREEPFPGEARRLIPSDRVATYDLAPAMQAASLGSATAAAIRAKSHALVVVNLANPDMVGHTGHLAATIRACEAVDAALAEILAAHETVPGALLAVTGDHGNAESMIDEHGRPRTSHTTSPVPLLLAGDAVRGRGLADGELRDIAPTLLAIAGIAPDPAMTGRSLLLP